MRISIEVTPDSDAPTCRPLAFKRARTAAHPVPAGADERPLTNHFVRIYSQHSRGAALYQIQAANSEVSGGGWTAVAPQRDVEAPGCCGEQRRLGESQEARCSLNPELEGSTVEVLRWARMATR